MFFMLIHFTYQLIPGQGLFLVSSVRYVVGYAIVVCFERLVNTQLPFDSLLHSSGTVVRALHCKPYCGFKGKQCRLCGLTGSPLDHRSLPPEFKSWCGHI